VNFSMVKSMISSPFSPLDGLYYVAFGVVELGSLGPVPVGSGDGNPH